MNLELINSSKLNRLLAKAIDIVVILVFFAISPLYPANALAALIYCLIADGLGNGQSLGKRIIGLRVVHNDTDEKCTFKESLIRNALLGFAAIFGIIPVWGWMVFILFGLPFIFIEIYLMMSLETGSRLGDLLANTKVVEAPKNK